MVRVKDSFAFPGPAGSTDRLGSGVVVVFDVPRREAVPTTGATVRLHRPDGTVVSATVGVVKDHGPEGDPAAIRSFLLPGLTQEDAPVGTAIAC